MTRQVTRNLTALLASQVASWALTLVMIVVVPRYLGDASFGKLSFAASFVGFFGLVAGFGTNTYITKAAARDPSLVGLYVFNALLMKLPVVLLLSAVAFELAGTIGFPMQTRLLILIACFGMAMTLVNGTLIAGLQAQQRMGKSALIATFERYSNGLLVLAVVARRQGLIALAIAQVATTVISVTGNAAQLARLLKRGARLDLRVCKLLLFGGAPFFLWGAALTIYGSIDVTMLSFMAGDAVVGWYALAYKLVGAPAFLPYLVVTAAFPALSAEGASATPGFVTLANRAIRLVFFVCLPMAVGIGCLAPDILHLFHYPRSFMPSIPLIRILALHIPLVGIDTVLGAVLMANDLQKRWVVVGFLAALLNPLANLIAIPVTTAAYGNGAIGASIVTVLTELFMMVGALKLRPAGVFDRATFSFTLRCLASALPMAGWLLGFPSALLPVKIAVAMVTYGVMALLLRTVTLTDLRQLLAQFIDRPRLRGASQPT